MGSLIFERLQKGYDLTAQDLKDVKNQLDSDKLSEDNFRAVILHFIEQSNRSLFQGLGALQVLHTASLNCSSRFRSKLKDRRIWLQPLLDIAKQDDTPPPVKAATLQLFADWIFLFDKSGGVGRHCKVVLRQAVFKPLTAELPDHSDVARARKHDIDQRRDCREWIFYPGINFCQWVQQPAGLQPTTRSSFTSEDSSRVESQGPPISLHSQHSETAQQHASQPASRPPAVVLPGGPLPAGPITGGGPYQGHVANQAFGGGSAALGASRFGLSQTARSSPFGPGNVSHAVYMGPYTGPGGPGSFTGASARGPSTAVRSEGSGVSQTRQQSSIGSSMGINPYQAVPQVPVAPAHVQQNPIRTPPPTPGQQQEIPGAARMHQVTRNPASTRFGTAVTMAPPSFRVPFAKACLAPGAQVVHANLVRSQEHIAPESSGSDASVPRADAQQQYAIPSPQVFNASVAQEKGKGEPPSNGKDPGHISLATAYQKVIQSRGSDEARAKRPALSPQGSSQRAPPTPWESLDSATTPRTSSGDPPAKGSRRAKRSAGVPATAAAEGPRGEAQGELNGMMAMFKAACQPQATVADRGSGAGDMPQGGGKGMDQRDPHMSLQDVFMSAAGQAPLGLGSRGSQGKRQGSGGRPSSGTAVTAPPRQVDPAPRSATGSGNAVLEAFERAMLANAKPADNPATSADLGPAVRDSFMMGSGSAEAMPPMSSITGAGSSMMPGDAAPVSLFDLYNGIQEEYTDVTTMFQRELPKDHRPDNSIASGSEKFDLDFEIGPKMSGDTYSMRSTDLFPPNSERSRDRGSARRQPMGLIREENEPQQLSTITEAVTPPVTHTQYTSRSSRDGQLNVQQQLAGGFSARYAVGHPPPIMMPSGQSLGSLARTSGPGSSTSGDNSRENLRSKSPVQATTLLGQRLRMLFRRPEEPTTPSRSPTGAGTARQPARPPPLSPAEQAPVQSASSGDVQAVQQGSLSGHTAPEDVTQSAPDIEVEEVAAGSPRQRLLDAQLPNPRVAVSRAVGKQDNRGSTSVRQAPLGSQESSFRFKGVQPKANDSVADRFGFMVQPGRRYTKQTSDATQSSFKFGVDDRTSDLTADQRMFRGKEADTTGRPYQGSGTSGTSAAGAIAASGAAPAGRPVKRFPPQQPTFSEPPAIKALRDASLSNGSGDVPLNIPSRGVKDVREASEGVLATQELVKRLAEVYLNDSRQQPSASSGSVKPINSTVQPQAQTAEASSPKATLPGSSWAGGATRHSRLPINWDAPVEGPERLYRLLPEVPEGRDEVEWSPTCSSSESLAYSIGDVYGDVNSEDSLDYRNVQNLDKFMEEEEYALLSDDERFQQNAERAAQRRTRGRALEAMAATRKGQAGGQGVPASQGQQQLSSGRRKAAAAPSHVREPRTESGSKSQGYDSARQTPSSEDRLGPKLGEEPSTGSSQAAGGGLGSADGELSRIRYDSQVMREKLETVELINRYFQAVHDGDIKLGGRASLESLQGQPLETASLTEQRSSSLQDMLRSELNKLGAQKQGSLPKLTALMPPEPPRQEDTARVAQGKEGPGTSATHVAGASGGGPGAQMMSSASSLSHDLSVESGVAAGTTPAAMLQQVQQLLGGGLPGAAGGGAVTQDGLTAMMMMFQGLMQQQSATQTKMMQMQMESMKAAYETNLQELQAELNRVKKMTGTGRAGSSRRHRRPPQQRARGIEGAANGNSDD